MDNSKQALLETLTAYSHLDYYPFHMPGHKRQVLDFSNPWTVDITEIDGFDNLHHAEGLLLTLQQQAASLFGASESYYLINGSTCGLLSAISGCVKRKGRILISRNCHKSVYHGVFLRQLAVSYLMPEPMEAGILGSICPKDVAAALRKEPDIQAVLIVSPTYDGVVSDIKAIASLVHQHGIPLIVDEAHGAHFTFSDYFPASALSAGADVVIQSLHKTLPAFTQSALLHLNSDRVDRAAIRRFLGIYQTSSPSYLLMASMDYCVRLLKTDGKRLFSAFENRLDAFYQACRQLKYIHVLDDDRDKHCFDKDRSKLLMFGNQAGYSGQELYELLLHTYHLQMEMAAGSYVLALTSLMDSQEGFDRLLQALFVIDKDSIRKLIQSFPGQQANASFYQLPQQLMNISTALDFPARAIPIADSLGKISQEYLYLYPPGIPILAPGELIDQTLLDNICTINKLGLRLEGLCDTTNRWINIVNL